MARLIAFNFVTLNGFFTGPGGDISWHKDNDPEKNEYAQEGLSAESILLFGRITYNMMAGFWPSPDAIKYAPSMAEGMNKAGKIVFSKTLQKAEWNNTKIISGNIFEEVRKMKAQDKNMTILGSGSIVTQFAEQGLLDEFQLMIDPVIIGEGTPMFKGIHQKLDVELIDTKTFKSGVVLLTYKPLKK